MQYTRIAAAYVVWHYGQAFRDIFGIWTNFLWFFSNFFSIGLLFRTLFSPWKRLHEERKGGLNFDDIAGTLIVNTLMRIVGALVRLWVIALGLALLLVLFVGGVLFFAVWFFLPMILASLLVVGLSMLATF